ncbi:hypothetical protein R3P38DRAFT_2990943 [Favolaschia claudopus]|uniref:Uncharacterized protein n=1 Tax=Favolaschia claudopus TaxID=2862362 RepID=A0AAW0AU82_9AGAR
MRLTRPTVGMPRDGSTFRWCCQMWSTYGLVAWYQPIRGQGRLKGSVGVANQLQRVQRSAVRLITGADANHAMEYHAFVAPVRLRLNRTAKFNALVAEIPPPPPSRPWCAHHYVQRHRSPLHELFHAFPDACDTEIIDPLIVDTASLVGHCQRQGRGTQEGG